MLISDLVKELVNQIACCGDEDIYFGLNNEEVWMIEDINTDNGIVMITPYQKQVK